MVENSENPEDIRDRQVIVSEIGPLVDEAILQDQFKEFNVDNIFFRNKETAVIEFLSSEDAVKAQKEMDFHSLRGRNIKVELANKKNQPQLTKKAQPSPQRTQPATVSSQNKEACFKCGGTGHWSSQCRGRNQSAKRGPFGTGISNRGGAKSCFNCGRQGHWQRECRGRRWR